MNFRKIISFTLLALPLALNAQAQTPTVTSELDSTYIFIGGQVGLNVTVTMPRNFDGAIVTLPDTLGNTVEVVEALKPDTLTQGDLMQIMYRYMITSFDSGMHYVAPQPTVFLPDSTVISTQDFALSVYNPFQSMEVDEASGINKITDIREAENAPFQWRELLQYWPWAVGVLLIAGLVVLGIWLKKKYGGKSSDKPVKKEPEEPCEVTALRNIERIKEERLWAHNRVKDFYSDLTGTLRKYVEQRYGISAMEQTSSQIMDELETALRDHASDIVPMRQVLELADFVKFAKVEPLQNQNDEAIKLATDFVNNTTEFYNQQKAQKENASAQAADAEPSKEA